MLDEFHGDETLLTSHKTSFFSLIAMSIKMMVFNVMKLPLKLALERLMGDFVRLICNEENENHFFSKTRSPKKNPYDAIWNKRNFTMIEKNRSHPSDEILRW